MTAKLRAWWNKAGGHTKTIVFIALMGVLIGVLIFLGYFLDWSWTGFKEKTLWDWLNLLGVLAIPVVVGLGTAWYTAQQGKVNDKENTDNQRETALQGYIDKMSELLLEKNLRGSAENDEVRNIARVRTLNILSRLDGERKRSVLQFLFESNLIDNGIKVINLEGADLRETWLLGADLRGADLSFADLGEAGLVATHLERVSLVGTILWKAELHWANLSEADLERADLSEADLREADLSGANLSEADLTQANLKGAIGITIEELEKAKSLQGAILPDGSKHS